MKKPRKLPAISISNGKIVGMALLVLAIGLLATTIISLNLNIDVLNPQGIVANKQKDLLLFTTMLGMVVIIPVFVMLFGFAYKYRASNTKAKHAPDEKDSWLFEVIWWGIPIIIVGILSVVTWFTTHDLDPYRKLDSNKTALKVQVVALQWKWLFIYPDHDVASVNELRIPAGRPVDFEITADAPMSTFWIPSLGSQVYAMNGMTSKLSLEAENPGTYRGTNTNISGEGYSKMDFNVIASSDDEFKQWAKNAAQSDRHLDWGQYEKLAAQSHDNPVAYYMLHEPQLQQRIIAKYMDHDAKHKETGEMKMSHEGMSH